VARFTILGVGNNPGIYIIAAGAGDDERRHSVAFYVKPWLMRRRRSRSRADRPRRVPGQARSQAVPRDRERDDGSHTPARTSILAPRTSRGFVMSTPNWIRAVRLFCRGAVPVVLACFAMLSTLTSGVRAQTAPAGNSHPDAQDVSEFGGANPFATPAGSAEPAPMDVAAKLTFAKQVNLDPLREPGGLSQPAA